ncbi:hypothetical protein [Ferrovum sp.]|uniref:hypothetical protein n=1 Tax=Ferrovum sp. TaxID=2609467 RepID=UPI00261D51B7|nr:hypothetical protein [Ferrovum sp.]
MTIQIARTVLLASKGGDSKKEFPKKYYELTLIDSFIGLKKRREVFSPCVSLLVRRWGVVNKVNGVLRMSRGAIKIEKYLSLQLAVRAFYFARKTFLEGGHCEAKGIELRNTIGEIPLDVSGNWLHLTDEDGVLEIQRSYALSRSDEICLHLGIAIPPHSTTIATIANEQTINSPEWGTW